MYGIIGPLGLQARVVSMVFIHLWKNIKKRMGPLNVSGNSTGCRPIILWVFRNRVFVEDCNQGGKIKFFHKVF